MEGKVERHKGRGRGMTIWKENSRDWYGKEYITPFPSDNV